MAEKQNSKTESKRHTQPPISIPFIWEEKPGTPIKHWKPTCRPVKPVDPPVKLVVSVPFGWEEKPGTPLPYFSQPQKTPSPMHTNHDDQSYQHSDTEFDTYNNETDDDSFTSAPFLVNNGQMGQRPDSPSYETDSSFDMSYATRSGSLAGSSFLEWLFPLLVPNSSSRDKVPRIEKHPSRNEDANDKDFGDESKGSQVRRPLLTLGELIVMSRRMSCKRKVIKMHKQSSMELMKGNAFGCCIFGGGITS